jgi:hypothetical protein
MKTDNTNSPAEHKGWNRLLILIVAISLLLIGYLTVVQNTFATSDKLLIFLKEAKAFNYTADIVKSEISDKLPQKTKDNIIQSALISKFMDYIITPDNVEKLAGPGLKLAYKAADTPTSIVNNKIVIDTTTYKSQASSYIGGLKLADALAQPANDLINSVPTQLTLVDNNKNPNNPLELLIKLRNGLHTVKTVLTYSWWTVVVAILVILVLNLRNLKRLFKSLTWGFAIPGVFIVVGSWLFPALISVFGPKSTDPVIGDSTNGLINSVITTLFTNTRTFGLVCLVIAIIAGLIYYFVPLQKVQDQIDSLLDKLHKKPKSNHSHQTHHESEHHQTKTKTHKK